MAYTTLLFDIDNTLLDFQAAEKQAITSLFTTLGLPLDPRTYQYYHTVNENLWKQFELGQVSRERLLVKRFEKLFHYLGDSPVPPAEAEGLYRRYLADGHASLPHAKALLSELMANHSLYVITNGVAQTQQKRLNEAGLTDYFQQVFISEVIGAKKPETQFFDAVANGIAHFEPSKALVVGDSISSDITGAARAHLDSVWFNPRHVPNASPVKPTYEVADLREILTIAG